MVRGSAVLCSVRFLYVLNTTNLRPCRFHCDYIASPRRPSATQMRLCYVLCVLTATLRRILRLCCDYGDLTRTQQECSFCDCFVHVQNIRRRSATLCVLGFLATTSLHPCCVHGDCAASWVVARTQ